jgi:hypothetical protein
VHQVGYNKLIDSIKNRLFGSRFMRKWRFRYLAAHGTRWCGVQLAGVYNFLFLPILCVYGGDHKVLVDQIYDLIRFIVPSTRTINKRMIRTICMQYACLDRNMCTVRRVSGHFVRS